MSAPSDQAFGADDAERLADTLRHQKCAAFRQRIGELPKDDTAPTKQLMAEVLAADLDAVQREWVLEDLAEHLSVKRRTIDALVKEMGAGTGPAGAKAAPPKSSGIANPEAVAVPAPLLFLANTVVTVLHRQVMFGDHQAVAVTLWTLGTFGFKDGPIFPRLLITSPTKRCGKSTLLSTVAALSNFPLRCDNISPAALFRVIEVEQPTLLIDEVDRFVRNNDELIGILNSGYASGGNVLRSVPAPDGKSWITAAFPTYAPVALSGIGSQADTIVDRSITVALQRAPKSTRKRPLRARALGLLRDELVPHLVSHAAMIRAAIARGGANFPIGLDDRQQDNWDSLLALADLIGGDWPHRARAAALALCIGRRDTAAHIDMLLFDIRDLVRTHRAATAGEVRAWQKQTGRGTTETEINAWYNGSQFRPAGCPKADLLIASESIVQHLNQLEHRPWPSYGRDGRGITKQKLASMLARFEIEPKLRKAPALARQLGRSASDGIRTYTVAELRTVCRQYL